LLVPGLPLQDQHPDTQAAGGQPMLGTHTLSHTLAQLVPQSVGGSVLRSHTAWQVPVQLPPSPAGSSDFGHPGESVWAYAGVAATDWTTGIAQAIVPVIAAFRRNSRRFSPFFSWSAMCLVSYRAFGSQRDGMGGGLA
jgi:hypothetical protein